MEYAVYYFHHYHHCHPAAGVGVAYLSLDSGAGVLTIVSKWWGLSGAPTMAHIHGASGTAFCGTAAVLQQLDPVAMTNGSVYVVILAPGVSPLLASGNAYINIHTAAYPGGEIRGHIAFSNVGLAVLSPYQEYQYWVPAPGFGAVARNNSAGVPISEFGPTSGGFGVGQVLVDDTNSIVQVTVLRTFNIFNVTMMHLHGPGAAGGAGPVVCQIALPLINGSSSPSAATVPCAGLWSPTVSADIRAGRYYLNVHTTANPDGELRGQVLFPSQLDANRVYVAALTSGAEVPNPSPLSPNTASGLIIPYVAYTTTATVTTGGSSGDTPASGWVSVVSTTASPGSIAMVHLHAPASASTSTGRVADVATSNPITSSFAWTPLMPAPGAVDTPTIMGEQCCICNIGVLDSPTIMVEQ